MMHSPALILSMMIAHGVAYLALLTLAVLAIVWLVRSLSTPTNTPDRSGEPQP